MSNKINWKQLSESEKKATLVYYYMELKLSQDKIATELNMSQTGVSKLLRRYEIHARNKWEANIGIHKWGGTRKCPWISKSNIDKPRKEKHKCKCVVCGKEIIAPNSSKRKYCSYKCRGIVLSQKFKGRKVPWHDKAIQTMVTNKSSFFLKYRNDHNFIKKMLKGLIERPTKPEAIFINFINKFNLPFKYVGDGGLVIGRMNPDFIHNTDKKIIEIFGRVYHDNNKSFFDIAYNRTAEGRISYFSQFGYECLIIWDDELNDEQYVFNKVKDFMIEA